MERAIFDRMAAIDAEHWWFAGRRRIVGHAIERLAPALPETARILEVGCGTGSNLLMLQRYGRVDAIEPDASARRLASERGGIAVASGLLPDGVKLRDRAYDLIVLLDVLEHVERDRDALAVLRAKLRPGGRLLLTVPAAPWMWSGHDVAHHHKRRYTVATLCGVLADGGYRLVHMSHFNTLLFPLIAAMRLLRPHAEGGDDAMPPAPLNGLLGWLFAAERHLATRITLPFGVSLLAIAEPS
jgi:SAM-dependent methyltransferase